MVKTTPKVILDGKLLPKAEALVPVTSRGLLYGDGCFETFHSYNGRFLELQLHLKRLAGGLEFLSIKYPEDLKVNSLEPRLQSLLTANNLTKKNAVIRIQVWRKGGRGYKTSMPSEANYSVTADSYLPRSAPYKLATVDVKRVPSSVLSARYKMSNGINYITAAAQATRKGADDALMETIDNTISETTIANIFWLKHDAVYTPSVACDILPGITRKICLMLLRDDLNVKVNEGFFTIDEVKNADAVWVCNSLKEIQPVAGIDDTGFDENHAFIQTLVKMFKDYREGQLSKGENEKSN